MCCIVWHADPPQSLRHLHMLEVSALLLVTFPLISGCATASLTRENAAQFSQSGMAAADAALGTYDALRAVASDNAYYQSYLRIVVSPEPDKVDFVQVSDADMSRLIDQRAAAFEQFRKAHALFQRLCSERGDADTSASQSYASLFETLKGLSKDESVSTESKRSISELPGAFTALLQARKIGQIRAVLEKLSSELGALWNHDLAIWDSYIDAVYIEHYAAALRSLRLSAFDEKELAKAVDDPYPIPVKAGLYKLQKYREASLKADRLKKELRQVSAAFQQLEDHHRLLPEAAVPPSRLRDGQRAAVGAVTKDPQRRKE